jgi:PmbA protein
VIGAADLLDLADRGVAVARKGGADQAEVFVESVRAAEVELQKDDIHTASTADEVSIGIRVVRGGSVGFATVNGEDRLERACEDALAMAAASPPDPRNGLGEPEGAGALPLEFAPDAAIAELTVERLVELAAGVLERVRSLDPRVRIDSGGVSAAVSARAIATSTGIRQAEDHAGAQGYLFGMAVDGDEVGSFDAHGQAVLRAADLAPELDRVAERFVERCIGALGARSGETYRGPVLLAPEVVSSFVLADLISVLTGRAVRTGRCPVADKVGQAVAAPELTIVDDARMPGGTASAAFDREGTPTGRTPLLTDGVLRGFLYDVYEARVAAVRPTGHARGGATSQPTIGVSNLLVSPGGETVDELCRVPRIVLVNRFSGSSDPVTGEFSGVVKGGFLLRNGERIPLRETLIAGNLYDLLRRISGVSRERENLYGRAWIPALRVEDVSVTAG